MTESVTLKAKDFRILHMNYHKGNGKSEFWWMLDVSKKFKTKEKAEQLKKQILENQKLANRWKIFNTIFTEKIDWHNIEFVAIKQNGKDMITARMG